MSYFPKPSLNENDLAIIERGDTAAHSIDAGQYVSWHGKTGKAKAVILQGATLSDSLFDYDEDGILNASIFDLLLTATYADGATHPTNTLAYPLSNYKEIVVMFLANGVSDRGPIYTIPKFLFVDYGCSIMGYGGGHGYLGIKPTSDTNCSIEQGNVVTQYTIKVYGKR